MVAKKKGGTKKKAVKKAPRAAKVIKTPYTRSNILTHIADGVGLTKKQAGAVLDELKNIIEGHIKNGGARVFTLPGLLKIKVVRKPATKARKGINPFTGQETIFKAKPARNVVKVQPLKGLKDVA